MPTLTDDQLAAWKQLQWATALITSRFRRDLAAAGLSLEQFDVLVHLAWAPSGTLPLHELTTTRTTAASKTRTPRMHAYCPIRVRGARTPGAQNNGAQSGSYVCSGDGPVSPAGSRSWSQRAARSASSRLGCKEMTLPSSTTAHSA